MKWMWKESQKLKWRWRWKESENSKWMWKESVFPENVNVALIETKVKVKSECKKKVKD